MSRVAYRLGYACQRESRSNRASQASSALSSAAVLRNRRVSRQFSRRSFSRTHPSLFFLQVREGERHRLEQDAGAAGIACVPPCGSPYQQIDR
jgi:hypothetical protein